jgi:hypothetical protein
MRALLIVIAVFSPGGSAFAAMSVEVGQVDGGRPGALVTVPITLYNTDAYELGGFDLVLRYDSTMHLETATVGQALTDCGWEQFGWRRIDSNTVRLTAFAEVSGGSPHPSCHLESSGELASLTFRLASQIPIPCGVLPISWLWFDCGDNTISSRSGDTLFISRDVYEYDGTNFNLVTADYPFPTPFGEPQSCPSNPRLVDYYTGGIHVFGTDPQPPVAICPNDTTVATDPGDSVAVVEFEATVTDNCPQAQIFCIPPSGTMFPIGVTEVTCIGVDAGGNSDNCNFFITVVDTEPPVITCPDGIYAESDPGQCGAIVGYSVNAVDNSSSVSLSFDPPDSSYFPIGQTQVTAVAADESGNADTCLFLVTVIDTEKPQAWCPEDITAPVDPGQCGARVYFSQMATDNCPGVDVIYLPQTGTLFPVGSTPVQAIAIDASGNGDTCVFNVSVIDDVVPQLTVPADINRSTDPGECGAVVDFQATADDNCSGATVTCIPESGSFFDVGTTQVLCIATDQSGNSDSGLFAITVTDTEPPEVIVPDDTVLATDPDRCDAVFGFFASVGDNCSGATVTCTEEGGYFDAGEHEIFCYGVDAVGNADTASFHVSVIDTQPPVLLCPDNVQLMNDSGLYGAKYTYPLEAEDNCSAVTITSSYPPEQEFDIGQTEVLLVAEDSFGLADTCLFTVTVTLNDPDGDGLPNWDDNCDSVANVDQADADNDGIGDPCDYVCGDADYNRSSNITDAVYIINWVFKGGPGPVVMDAADANCNGAANISDAVSIINWIFKGDSPPCCPS